MDHHQKRVSPGRLVIGGLDQPTLHRDSARARPMNPLGRGKLGMIRSFIQCSEFPGLGEGLVGAINLGRVLKALMDKSCPVAGGGETEQTVIPVEIRQGSHLAVEGEAK